MPRTDVDQWFLDEFDRFVLSKTTDAAILDDSRTTLSERYAEAVESGELDPPKVSLQEAGKRHFNRIINAARDKRRRSLKKELEYLLDCLRDETILGVNDPRFNQAFPLGTGADKTLGFWTITDWQTASEGRTIEAQDQTDSAAEFKRSVSILRGEMIKRGAVITADAFQGAEV